MSKKRFESEQQILEAIDKCHKDRKRLLAEAEEIERCVRFLRENDSETAKYELKRAGRLRRSAESVIENKARKLGYKLSEFRTGLLFPELPKDIPR